MEEDKEENSELEEETETKDEKIEDEEFHSFVQVNLDNSPVLEKIKNLPLEKTLEETQIFSEEKKEEKQIEYAQKYEESTYQLDTPQQRSENLVVSLAPVRIEKPRNRIDNSFVEQKFEFNPELQRSNKLESDYVVQAGTIEKKQRSPFEPPERKYD